MKKDKTIRDLVHEMHSELRDVYPERELNSLIKIVLTAITHLKKRHHLHIYQDQKADAEHIRQIKDITKQLKLGKPIQQILGETKFYDLTIKTSPAALIPRQETEELVDWMISDLKGTRARILDIGTGTGCIAIALARHLKNAQVEALDISQEALKLARENARLNGSNIRFLQADIFKAPSPEMHPTSGTYQVLVSNPPYIRESEKIRMHPNVLEHEPGEALFVSDEEPLIFYRQILEFADHYLDQAGLIWFEINEAFGKKMISLLEDKGYHNIHLRKDINDKDRMIKAQKP
ncbi:MAG: peptide chain release factor N(5)-glutamine methyltransferase [Bacteroidales bacterium]|nr:peptide chain release factor N(5)-glutamine methyltransferase [Bacteroidales bacterium]